jgi:N-acetylglucosaminyl-diphospho-decaprenol L-rhamnosyltransferase
MHLLPMRIDYVLVAYRSSSDLPGCLASIGADAPSDAGVIVVDNASPDDPGAVIEAHPVKARLVRSDRNLGFGGGCNLGARHSDADALFFVNPDARLEPGVSAALAAALERDARAAVAAPRVVDPTGQSRAASAGAEPSLRSTVGHFLLIGRLPVLGRLFRPLHLADGARQATPDWVSAAAMLVRRDPFEQIGGFDERIFLYMEDVDLCRRLRSAGWRILYDPNVRVEHGIGGSQSGEQPSRWFDAFYAYVREQHGGATARASSLVAGVGLGLRAVAYRVGRPANSARTGRAARTALRLALRGR